MKQGLIGLACILLACAALAEGPAAVRKRAEASMLVKGSIELAPDGSVRNFVVDKPDKLPPVVLKLVQQNVPTWKFTLKDPTATTTKARMALRVIAKRIDEQHDSIAISAANFAEDEPKPGQHITYKSKPSPRYPFDALSSHVSGTVYVLLQVGRDGLVKDALVEQVNLDQYASDSDMRRFRNDFAKASLAAMRHWTFNPPTTGKEAGDPYWCARIPVAFDISGWTHLATYGEWNAYIPGPREPVPASWTNSDRLLSGSPDATPAGTLDTGNADLKLLTSLSGS